MCDARINYFHTRQQARLTRATLRDEYFVTSTRAPVGRMFLMVRKYHKEMFNLSQQLLQSPGSMGEKRQYHQHDHTGRRSATARSEGDVFTHSFTPGTPIWFFIFILLSMLLPNCTFDSLLFLPKVSTSGKVYVWKLHSTTVTLP